MEFLKANKVILFKAIFPVLLGAFGGFAFYFYNACSSGSCPITSNPWISILYGALFGAIFIPSKSLKVLFSILKGKKND
ncbi:MAG: DUF6132 family protein [Bacteroidota bacterium]|nr:DUF6132 family protein [Bacteroidota bacterium]